MKFFLKSLFLLVFMMHGSWFLLADFTIDDGNFDTYASGVTIPADTICTWNCSPDKVFVGQISFEANSSSLALVKDIYLADGASFIGSEDYCSLSSSGGNMIVRGAVEIKSPIQSTTGYVIDGQNSGVLKFSSCPGLDMSQDEAVTIKNIKLEIQGDASVGQAYVQSPCFLFGYDNELMLDTVSIVLLQDVAPAHLLGSFNQVVLKNKVSIEGRDKSVLFVSDASSIALAPGALFYIGADVNFEAAQSRYQYALDDTATLYLDGCTLFTGPDGLAIEHGIVVFARKNVVVYSKALAPGAPLLLDADHSFALGGDEYAIAINYENNGGVAVIGAMNVKTRSVV